jgi:hypothetical protein
VKLCVPLLATVTVAGLTVTLLTVAVGGGGLSGSSSGSVNRSQPTSSSAANPTISAGAAKPAMRSNSRVLFMKEPPKRIVGLLCQAFHGQFNRIFRFWPIVFVVKTFIFAIG